MCLHYSIGDTVKKAAKNIVCYKIVESIYNINDEKEKRIVTPFIGMTIPSEIIDGKQPLLPDSKRKRKNEFFNTISEGYIHVYGNLDEAEEDLNTYYKDFTRHETDTVHDAVVGLESFMLYKCVIPAGTLYWKGVTDWDEFSTYAAEKIVFKNLLYTVKDQIVIYNISGNTHK